MSLTLTELQSEMLKTLERAATAEQKLHKRDSEIRRLRDRLTSLEDEGIRIDSELQSSYTSNTMKLHNDNESVLNEGRVLLSQLSRRDEEVALQCQEIDKLRATIAKLSAQQVDYQKDAKNLELEQRHEINNLQEKLQYAIAAGHAKEMELASYTEKCSGLDQERQSLLHQLHQALERADLASQRAEELQRQLHCTAERRARASEDVAREMVDHLKRLTGHMKGLETSMDKTALGFPVGVFQKKAVAASLAKLSSKLAHADNLIVPPKLVPSRKEDCRRQVCFSFPDKKECWSESERVLHQNGNESPIKTIDRDIALTIFKTLITWKWRWAASATKVENLEKKLQLKPVATVAKDPISNENESQQERSLPKQQDVFRLDDLIVADNQSLRDVILKQKLVPLMMMAWRAFARLSNLERMTRGRNESLKRIISALPWWIRRVGERRAFERYFFHWQLLTLRANRAKIQQQQQQQKRVIPSSRPTPESKLQSKLASNQVPQVAATVLVPPPPRTIYQDAESQTERSSRVSEVENKQDKSHTGTKPITLHAKSESKTAPPLVSKSDPRMRFTGDGQRTGRNQETRIGINSTPAVRQQCAFQTPFHDQQELREFQDVLSREMNFLEQIPLQRPNNTYGRLSGAGQIGPAKQALKSVFNVCNNLAQALSEVRAQLCGAESQTRDRTIWGAGRKMKRCSITHSEAQDDWEGGGVSMLKDKDTDRQQNLSETTHHYALPIGRIGRFKSSPYRQQPREAFSSSGEGWPSLSTATGAVGNKQLRPGRQSCGNSSDQVQYLHEEKDDTYRFRHGRAKNQTDRRPLESGRGPRLPAQAKRDDNYDFRNEGQEFQVDPYLYGNTSVKHQHPQAGRDDGNQTRSGGLTKRLSDTGRIKGRVARTLAGIKDEDVSPSISRPPPPDCLHTTVVQILNQDNNKIGEVAIHTHPLNGGGVGSGKTECMSREADSRSTTRIQSVKDDLSNNTTVCRTEKLEMPQEAGDDHPRPSTAPRRSRDLCRPSVRPSTAVPHFHQTSTAGRQNNNLNRRATNNYIASLRRKQCIGSDYAELLRAEIVRLREDRISLEDKSLNTGFGAQRELPLVRRPGWRNVH